MVYDHTTLSSTCIPEHANNTHIIDDSYDYEFNGVVLPKWYHIGLPYGHTEFNKFISKVMSIIMFQIFITFAITAFIYNYPPAAEVFKEQYISQIVAGVIALISLIFLIPFRHIPYVNWLLLIVFTISVSLMFAAMAVYFTAYQIVEACGIVSIIFSTLLIIILVIKVDCTHIAFIIMTLTSCLIWWSLFAFLITPIWYSYQCGDACYYNYWFQLLIIPFILFYVGCLLFDLSTLKGYNYDEYMIAAITIYMDVIMILMYVLQYIGISSNR